MLTHEFGIDIIVRISKKVNVKEEIKIIIYSNGYFKLKKYIYNIYVYIENNNYLINIFRLDLIYIVVVVFTRDFYFIPIC